MKEKPDSFVDDRRLKAYPTEIGSQKFSPDDIQLFKLEKTSKLKHLFSSKFSELQSEYKKLIDVIHELDNKNAEILLHKNKKSVIDVSLPDLNPVWKDEKRKIYVYRADNIFQSIALGKGTNFCISSDYKNGENYFLDYMYNVGSKYYENYIFYSEQKSSIYFVKSPSQEPKYQTLAIDAYKGGGFLYTDVRNNDKEFNSYEKMVENEYTSSDLNFIPKDIFKFVLTIPTKEEILIENKYIFNNSLSLIFLLEDSESLNIIKNIKGKHKLDKLYYLFYVGVSRKLVDQTWNILKIFIDENIYLIYSALLHIRSNSKMDFFRAIFDKLERKYKVFLITMISFQGLYDKDVDKIILGTLKDGDLYFNPHKDKELIKMRKSLNDLTLSEIKEVLENVEIPKDNIGIDQIDRDAADILDHIEKYGDLIFKVIYYELPATHQEDEYDDDEDYDDYEDYDEDE
jgi:hypothetical protein